MNARANTARKPMTPLEQFQAERAAAKVGDTRDAEMPCPKCKGARTAVLEEIAAAGGRRWGMFCPTCSPRKQGGL